MSSDNATNSATPTPVNGTLPSMMPSESIIVGNGAECVCETLKILTREDDNTEFINYLEKYIESYKNERPCVRIEVEGKPFGSLENDMIQMAMDKDKTYDGFVHPARILGTLITEDYLWDLTDFVKNEVSLAWDDVLNFYRARLAVYDDKVKTIPLDGDLLLMYYRKDLFDTFERKPPRTWDEYSDTIKFFHGRKYKDQPILGNCVTRSTCGGVNGFWARLILFSMTQYEGSNSGALFNPENMTPLLGDAMVETLKHLTNQMRFDNVTESISTCLAYNSETFNNGRCAITYNWGNQISSSFTLQNETGVIRTPGSTHFLNRTTLKLEKCSRESCPFSEYHDDLGYINYAPYAAFAGWTASVNNLVDDAKKKETAMFFSYLSASERSSYDVIPTQNSDDSGVDFADPYRFSHMDIEKWKASGFSEDFARRYTEALRDVDNENTVVELRIPLSLNFSDVLSEKVADYMNDIQNESFDDSYEKRFNVTRNITEEIEKIISKYDTNQITSKQAPLLESYQRSLGLFRPEGNPHHLSSTSRYVGYSLCGSIFLCAFFLCIWTIIEWRSKYFKNSHRSSGKVVRASQPFLLLSVCIGVMIMCGTVVPISVDDGWASQQQCDDACRMMPWIYFLGFSLFYTALFSKNWRNYMILDNPELFTRLKVPKEDFGKIFGIIWGINAALLLAWGFLSPLRWERRFVEDPENLRKNSREDDILLDMDKEETYGICTGEDTELTTIFALTTFMFNFMALLISLFLCYKCSKIQLEFEENKWIFLCMVGFVQIWAIGAPLYGLFVIAKLVEALYILQVGIIFTTCGSVLLLIFGPKYYYTLKQRKKEKNAGTGGGQGASMAGTTTPGSSFYSQSSMVLAQSQNPLLDTSVQNNMNAGSHKRRRSSFGIKVLSHPVKEDVQLVKLKARLAIAKIAIEDTQEMIKKTKEELGKTSFPGSGVYMKPTIATNVNRGGDTRVSFLTEASSGHSSSADGIRSMMSSNEHNDQESKVEESYAILG